MSEANRLGLGGEFAVVRCRLRWKGRPHSPGQVSTDGALTLRQLRIPPRNFRDWRLGMRNVSKIACLMLIAGCGSDSGARSDRDESAVLDADAAVQADAGTNACKALGGICTSNDFPCAQHGGTPKPAGDSGCIFDDGPGTCCAPPLAQSGGDTCASYGGVIAPIAGCFHVKGHISLGGPDDPHFPGYVCCVLESACPNPEPACCDLPTQYRAVCTRGSYVCAPETGTIELDGDCFN